MWDFCWNSPFQLFQFIAYFSCIWIEFVIHCIFQAHVLLHFIHSINDRQSLPHKQQQYEYSKITPTSAQVEAHIAESCKMVSAAYCHFKSKAAEQVSECSYKYGSEMESACYCSIKLCGIEHASWEKNYVLRNHSRVKFMDVYLYTINQ